MTDEENKLQGNYNDKCITENSFVADINTLKMPLFLYSNYKPELDSNGEAKVIEEKRYRWLDSKNNARELYVYCKGRLPRKFESDTLHGLLGLFVKKYGPFSYDNESKTYKIKGNSLEFSWYELCSFMNIPSTGYYIDRLKEAIRIMKQTQYFSYENGALYDKENNKYINSGEEGLSLISKYKFKTTKKGLSDEYSTTINSNYVIFDELIINNLRYEYFKYLDADLYFKVIPSGIERGIYGYLESNRYDSKNKSLRFLKRSFTTLKMGIPVEFDYPSELKRKLKKPLNHLKEIGYLSDWAFGDELKINGLEEQCVYFAFTVTVSEMKNILEKKKKKVEQKEVDFTYDNDSESGNKEDKPYLKEPTKNLIQELIDRKVDRDFAEKVVKTKDKWDIITYILWVDKQVYLNKNITDTGAILAFALRREYKLGLSDEYIDILTFVEDLKLQSSKSYDQKQKRYKELYNEYIEKEIEDFKQTAEYGPIKDLLLNFQNDRIDTNISMAIKNNQDVSKYKEFKEKQDESEYFKEILTKEIRMIKSLKSEKEFINQLIMNENS